MQFVYIIFYIAYYGTHTRMRSVKSEHLSVRGRRSSSKTRALTSFCVPKTIGKSEDRIYYFWRRLRMSDLSFSITK